MNHSNASEKIQLFLEEEFKRTEFLFLNDIFDLLSEIEVYLVGGAIRDILLDRKAKDFDFVVRNIEQETLEDFLVQYGKLIYVGKQFGVYKLRPYDSEEEIDIAFPRREVSKGPGYKEFEIIADSLAPIQEDLLRRDFTINAFAYSIKEKTLIDNSGGLADIDSKVVRTVGDAKKRFEEDYTRMLRCIRQSLQLDFSIEKDTLDVMNAIVSDINEPIETFVSTEMISKEFIKSFENNPLRTIELYDETGLLVHILPEVEQCKGVLQNADYHPEGDVFEHILLILSKLMPTDSLRLKLAALFHDIAKPLTFKEIEQNGEKRYTFYGHQDKGVEVFNVWAKRYSLPNKLIDDVSFLIKHHLYLWHGDVHEIKTSKLVRVFLDDYKLGQDLIRLHEIDISFVGKKEQESIEYVNEARKVIEDLKRSILSENQRVVVPVTGNDIIQHFPQKRGKEIGFLIEAVREKYLDEKGNGVTLSKEELIDFLKSNEQ